MNYTFDPRYQELERYDPMHDTEVVRLMAITEIGTFHMEKACPPGAKRRELRKQFKDHVLALMDEGREPCEVSLDR